MANEPNTDTNSDKKVDFLTEDNPLNESDKNSGGASGTTDPKTNPKDKPINNTLTGD